MSDEYRAEDWIGTPDIVDLLGRHPDSVRRLLEAGTWDSAYKPPGGHWRVLRAEVVTWRESTRPRKRTGKNG